MQGIKKVSAPDMRSLGRSSRKIDFVCKEFAEVPVTLAAVTGKARENAPREVLNIGQAL